MDAVKFIMERNRMCKHYVEKGGCAHGCPADGEACGIIQSMDGVKIVRIVEKWSKDHPRKTRQSEFLKQWPEARIDKETGVLTICPAELKKEYMDDSGDCNAYSVETGVCNNCRRKFWLEEVE